MEHEIATIAIVLSNSRGYGYKAFCRCGRTFIGRGATTAEAYDNAHDRGNEHVETMNARFDRVAVVTAEVQA